MSLYDDKIETLTQEKTKMVSKITACLENAQVDLDDVPQDQVEALLDKLDLVLLNYREDSHQMANLNSMNQTLTQDNQKLENANYDLRYELQELNIQLEKVQEELKRGNEKPLNPLFKDDDSFSGPTMVAQSPVSQAATNDAYADLSINKESAMTFPSPQSDE